MFFSPPHTQEPAGLFTRAHLLLFLITAALIAAGLWLARDWDDAQVRRAIRIVTAALWLLEIVKIVFVLAVTGSRNPNDFVPLYYCSLILYVGLFSSFGKGFFRKMGDCFIATGGLIGGLVFLLIPNTSLTRYPAIHFISWHSFLLHGLMVWLGLLLLLRGTYRLRLGDIFYCAAPVSVICALALLFNTVYDRVSGSAVANLMFVSKDFPGTPVSTLYHLCGPLFPFVMWLLQAFGPFLLVWGVTWLVRGPRRALAWMK